MSILPNASPALSNLEMGASPVFLFCALAEEFRATVDTLPPGTLVTSSDFPVHYQTFVKSQAGHRRLVIAVQTGVASVNAAISAARAFELYRNPQLAILVGITAGIRKKGVRLGDVLVPSATIDVEAGKVTPKGKEPAGVQFQVAPYLHNAVSSWPNAQVWARKYKTKQSGRATRPAIHTDCTLACTSSVVAYGEAAKAYKRQHRKITGIEMEAVGIGAACLAKHCPLLIVKAISDWADSRKNDAWHKYCMGVAADLVVRLLETETI